jgi:hypothetical protein
MAATQSTSNRTTVAGVFHDREDAREAVEDLKRVGFRDDQIGFASREAESTGGTVAAGDLTTDTGPGSGAAAGAVTGGLLGGLLGAAAALLIPGVGPVVAGGVLASALGGAALGAAGGGILGALVTTGVPEEEARYYDQEFQAGRTVVTVTADSRAAEAEAIMRRHNVSFAKSGQRSATASPMGGTAERTTTAESGVRVPVRSEEVVVTKEPVVTGVDRDRQDVAMPGGTAEYRQYVQEMRNDPRYRDRRFEEIESDLQKDWVQRHPSTPWETAKAYIREAWMDVKTAGR